MPPLACRGPVLRAARASHLAEDGCDEGAPRQNVSGLPSRDSIRLATRFSGTSDTVIVGTIPPLEWTGRARQIEEPLAPCVPLLGLALRRSRREAGIEPGPSARLRDPAHALAGTSWSSPFHADAVAGP